MEGQGLTRLMVFGLAFGVLELVAFGERGVVVWEGVFLWKIHGILKNHKATSNQYSYL